MEQFSRSFQLERQSGGLGLMEHTKLRIIPSPPLPSPPLQLYLLPDPQKQTKEKTRHVKQRDPVFNQKFSLCVDDQACMLYCSLCTVYMDHMLQACRGAG